MRFNDRLINIPSLNNVINPSPLTIKPDSFVVEAIFLMSQERCSNYAPTNLNSSLNLSPVNQPLTGCVLVLEGLNLLGIFTEKDVIKLIASGIDLSTVTIAQVMRQPVVTLRQSDSQDIFVALSLLRQHQTHYLPVLDDRGQLQGIITETSLLQAFDKESLRQANEELEQRVAERTAQFVMSNVLLQQEITERQRTEVALRQSENLYRQLVESQIDIIIRIDLQGQITFANTVAYQTFGWKEGELRGQSFFQFLDPDDLPEVMEDIAALGSSPHPLTNRERRAFTVNGICWFQKCLAVLVEAANLTCFYQQWKQLKRSA